MNDPLAQRCRSLALTRKQQDGVYLTEVEKAGHVLEDSIIFDAVAICRQALSAHRGDRNIVIAEARASTVLTILALGVGFPESEEEAVAAALRVVASRSSQPSMESEWLGMYLGSAYEYGIGVKQNRAEALKWYRFGAQGNDPILKRELARLESMEPQALAAGASPTQRAR